MLVSLKPEPKIIVTVNQSESDGAYIPSMNWYNMAWLECISVLELNVVGKLFLSFIFILILSIRANHKAPKISHDRCRIIIVIIN